MGFRGVHPLIKVFSLRQQISNGVCSARDMFQGVVEVLEVFNLTGLSAGNLVGVAEVLKVFVVCTDSDGVCSS